MKLHKNCITDPLAKEYWRDYQHVMREGNPLGLSFTEYVAFRVMALRVPLTALTYHLTKTDRDGNRVFFDHPPEGVVPPTPIDQTCDICVSKGVRKTFYSEYDYVGHMDSFHPREFAIMRERAHRIGGEIKATSAKGLGTCIQLFFPEPEVNWRRLDD